VLAVDSLGESDEVELELEPTPPSSAPPAGAGDAESLPDPAREVLDAADARSFFAHPEPLKWTAGVLKPLRIVPSAPHSGQKRGPGSLIPWITSASRRHLPQT
jgi:hypothetical protein